MNRRGKTKSGAADLRRRAEQSLKGRAARAPPSEGDAMKQLHELHVHQVELEMQNLELQRIREEVEAGLARYTALYDFAPVGYLTLDRAGVIAELNLTGAALLGAERAGLVGRRLADFVAAGMRRQLAPFLARASRSAAPATLELELTVPDRPPLFVHVEAAADASHSSCRVVLVDITARRQAEQRADELLRQNRALTRRLYDVQESDRRELARELHDELGQWLTAIQAEAEAIHSRPGNAADAATQSGARAILDSAGELHRVIRRMLGRLRPGLLDFLGLSESLLDLVAQWRARHRTIACDLKLTGELDDLPESIAIAVYRVAQESLTNVAKHSQATQVRLLLQRDPPAAGAAGSVTLTIQDNGRGLDPNITPAGLGLLGMRERVIAADGEFSVTGEPGRGVRIVVHLPLPAPSRAGVAS